MADKEFRALNRLVKKLSALRATLRSDERGWLDQLVLGSAAPVPATVMTTAASKAAKTPRSAEVAAHAMNTAASKGAKTPKPTEVAAHAMTTAASKGAKTPKPAEVAAHAMNTAASKGAKTPKPAEVAAHSLIVSIEFDADGKAYKVKSD